MAKVKITETVLRDSHQSLVATRMTTDEMLPILEKMDSIGYHHYADDVVEYFVQKSIANGIDILRIFDALNDPRNLKTAINANEC